MESKREMEAAVSYELLVRFCQTTHSHIPEVNNYQVYVLLGRPLGDP